MSKVKMEEVCDFINGGAWSDKEYSTSGLPVLKVSNCKNSGFELDEIDYLPYELEEKYHSNRLKKGDVIIATVGSHPNLKESAAGRSSIITVLLRDSILTKMQYVFGLRMKMFLIKDISVVYQNTIYLRTISR